MTLLRLARRGNDVPACLGFLKNIDQPRLRISGWTCQGDSLPARRAAIGCMLNRLMLLTAGNEPKTGRIVRPRRAQAGELRFRWLGNWVTDAENPLLRGAM